jgi:hypothetical protein
MVPPREDTMGTIRDKMTAVLDLRGFAATTKTEYLRCAKNFGLLRQICGRLTAELGRSGGVRCR